MRLAYLAARGAPAIAIVLAISCVPACSGDDEGSSTPTGTSGRGGGGSAGSTGSSGLGGVGIGNAGSGGSTAAGGGGTAGRGGEGGSGGSGGGGGTAGSGGNATPDGGKDGSLPEAGDGSSTSDVSVQADASDGADVSSGDATSTSDSADAAATIDAAEVSSNDGAAADAEAGSSLGPNLAGNGDLEYGQGTGWSNFCAGNGLLYSNSDGPISHGGYYTLSSANRSQTCSGPAYTLPAGPGKYVISGWAMQRVDATFSGNVQIALTCGAATDANHFPGVVFNLSMPQSVWTPFSGTVDTATCMGCADCLPGGGVVKSALLYLNQQTAAPTPVQYPELFIDDLVVQVIDGHNLVGNSDFESGVTNGWSNNGGGTVANTMSRAHGGARSLAVTGRTGSYNGPSYALPIGAAKYNVTFWAQHAGTTTHNLVLQTSYTCLGGTQQFPLPTTTATGVAAGSWTSVSGTVTMPPSGASVGCKLTQAAVYLQQESGCSVDGGIECPDLYVDDVSITLTP